MVILGIVLLFTFFLFLTVCSTLVSNVPRSVGWLFNRDFTYVSHTGEDAAVSSFEAQSHVGVADARQLILVCV